MSECVTISIILLFCIFPVMLFYYIENNNNNNASSVGNGR